MVSAAAATEAAAAPAAAFAGFEFDPNHLFFPVLILRAMIEFGIAVLLTVLAIVGLAFNVYIVLALAIAKQVNSVRKLYVIAYNKRRTI